MSNNFKRTDRIAETILRKLALLIQQEITDPRLSKFVTLSAVNVAKDLSHAKVYFTVLNDDPEQTATILNTAASYLRSQLAKSITLRTVPQLHFIYDESIEYGKRLSKLIEEANPEKKDDEQE
ncbi:ribosome-binding factor A (plasmid) [Legionella adelaidensis]|uniref:Ribosome-binding factor A n=1 Tax=Legionella adelaidensis TaxID=45056 RepID=A0A0W0R0G9_9GAMM|nr:30S ribosome-binding factor RbfA [Legionella adelaidensis]KTC64552.1 ribosome-binding factor A [Legionella adelaidensis]VEH85920.1 ribosome-binding factor A [Legionella adelaidensis]